MRKKALRWFRETGPWTTTKLDEDGQQQRFRTSLQTSSSTPQRRALRATINSSQSYYPLHEAHTELDKP